MPAANGGSSPAPDPVEPNQPPPAGSGEMPAPGFACPEAVLPAGDAELTVMVGGVERSFIRHVPPNYTGKTLVPLVFDWHPLFGSSTGQQDMSGYQAISDREGFIVVFPAGIDAAWNVGRCCTESRMVDDLGFARAMVEQLKSSACIDPKRIYATGFSMGGGMSHFLACNAADVFAAIAPAAFDLLIEEEEPCRPARPISVLSFRGTADPIVPYEGGESVPPTPYPLDPIHFLGAVGTFDRWTQLNQCTGTPIDSGNGCQTHQQCSGGVEVTLCTAQGGGHERGDAELGYATLRRFTLP